jgi:hypothetical protein
MSLPASPVTLANLIRDKMPEGASVVAIGGNMTGPTRIEIRLGADLLTLTPGRLGGWTRDGSDALYHDHVRVILANAV